MAVNKLTRLALDWHSDGIEDTRVLDNVVDEVIYDFLEEYGIELSDREEPRFEMLLRSIISENINWDALKEADQEARDYEDAKRSAIYK
jgi:hypothetical protein